jgi:hypothetical protein
VTLVLPHPADDRPEVIAEEVVGRDVVSAGVLEELPAGGAAALARVPKIALDPFARLVDAFLDEAPPNTARGYRTDLRQWTLWLTHYADPELSSHLLPCPDRATGPVCPQAITLEMAQWLTPALVLSSLPRDTT